MDKHFTASAVVLHPSREILLLKHKKLGVWLGPGGHIENETPDDCVLREVKEETGLVVRIFGHRSEELGDCDNDVTVLHHPYLIISALINDPNSPHYHIDLTYICVPVSPTNEIRPNEGESTNVKWVSESELSNLELFPNYRNLLKRIFADDGLWARAFDNRRENALA